MSLEEAFHHPRIDNSGGSTIIADEDLPPSVVQALEQVGQTVIAKRTVFSPISSPALRAWHGKTG